MFPDFIGLLSATAPHYVLCHRSCSESSQETQQPVGHRGVVEDPVVGVGVPVGVPVCAGVEDLVSEVLSGGPRRSPPGCRVYGLVAREEAGVGLAVLGPAAGPGTGPALGSGGDQGQHKEAASQGQQLHGGVEEV